MKDRQTGIVGVLGLALALLYPTAAGGWQSSPVSAAPPDDEPLELGLEESVEVQFVLVDFLVLDRRDRTVPDLAIEDFELLVDGRLTEIASLDNRCPAGVVADALPGKKPPSPPPPSEPAQPTRIVLVFDYDHMTHIAETFDQALKMLDDHAGGGEEHMIVSLGEVVRVEAPFTRDLDELRWALRRMRNDRDLFAGNTSRLTEHRFFERIHALFDILERFPGRKTVVLFSGPFQSDGFFHDPQYRTLSALSTTARTAVYPVDTGGLRTPGDPAGAPFGGPGELRRLANETGGRMTPPTNDITVAYAKAKRDLGCTYTLGFYDRRPRPDDNRRLTIRVQGRRGLRVVYPEFYVVRSPEEKRESLLRTASLAPHMFESSELSAELFVLAPRSRHRWRLVVGVELRLGPDQIVGDDETWTLKGLLRRPNGTVIRTFRRDLPVPPTDPTAGSAPPVTLFHELSAPPGEYVVSVVLSDPEGQLPRASTVPATLSKVPRNGPFLVGPTLGRRISADDVTKRDRRHPVFEPLLRPEAARGEHVDALTVLCVAGTGAAETMSSVERWIADLDGHDVHRFDTATVRIGGADRIECHELVDPLATGELAPGRYEVHATATSDDFFTGSGTTGLSVREIGSADHPDE